MIFLFHRRALVAQQEARAKEVMAQAKSLQSIMTAGRKALQVITYIKFKSTPNLKQHIGESFTK